MVREQETEQPVLCPGWRRSPTAAIVPTGMRCPRGSRRASFAISLSPP